VKTIGWDVARLLATGSTSGAACGQANPTIGLYRSGQVNQEAAANCTKALPDGTACVTKTSCARTPAP
jgi:hypothetical protein